MIRRLLFAIFFLLGGFLFYIPKWILVGTKAGRERRKLIKLQREQNDLLRKISAEKPARLNG